ncbi:MAG: SCO family protein [Sphingobacteriales bacterium]|nr:SCO family protein [Sphingobacteriales bacterium]MCC7224316.1 SCO family protein [Chitinophagales bacterium]
MTQQTFFWLIAASIFLTLNFSCTQDKKSCHQEIPVQSKTAATMDESIYNLSSEWKKQDGSIIKLDALKGKTVVMAMVFTHCQSACPRIVADMQRIQKEVGNQANVQYVLVSMDPERDTPERFAEFSNDMQLDPAWILISGSQSDTDEIANVLGVKVKKLSDGGFDHSNAIFVIDPNGIIIHTQEGLAQEPTETVQKIKSINS